MSESQQHSHLHHPVDSRWWSRVHVTRNPPGRRIFDCAAQILRSGFGLKRLLWLLLFHRLSLCFCPCCAASTSEPSHRIYTPTSDSRSSLFHKQKKDRASLFPVLQRSYRSTPPPQRLLLRSRLPFPTPLLSPSFVYPDALSLDGRRARAPMAPHRLGWAQLLAAGAVGAHPRRGTARERAPRRPAWKTPARVGPGAEAAGAPARASPMRRLWHGRPVRTPARVALGEGGLSPLLLLSFTRRRRGQPSVRACWPPFLGSIWGLHD